MLKPFNAESTKLGDPVVAKRFQRSTIEQARYLAKLEDGRHVVEFQAVTGSSFVEVLDEDSLFTAPRKRTVWINLHKQQDTGEIIPYLYDDESWAHSNRGGSMNCLGTFPIEIEE